MRLLVSLPLMLCLSLPGAAQAQLDDDLVPAERSFVSPENFALELRVGPYRPDDDPTFNEFFSDDDGLMLALQFDVFAYRMPKVFYLGGGGLIGWADYKGNALVEGTGEQAAEETQLTLMPLGLMATLRVDALSEMLRIPLIITGKLGFQWMRWSTNTGDANNHQGWSMGLTYALQLALDLNPLEPSAARAMDEEWAINRSFVFWELYGFSPRDEDHPLGAVAWTLGLGFHF